MTYNREQEQQELQRMYKSLKAEEGSASLNRFLEKYGNNHKARLSKAFGGGYWGKLVELCGDTARTFSSPAVGLEQILDDYGNLTRELGRPAVGADWQFKDLRPTVGGLKDGPHQIRLGQLPSIFIEQRGGQEKWEDVCSLLRNKKQPKQKTSKPQGQGVRKSPKYEGVLNSVSKWIPTERFRTEEGYQENLRAHLERSGYSIRTQRGDSLIDLLVDNEIAVEVKKAPMLAEYDRLFGQIARHCDQFGQVIAVICDVSTADAFNDFNARLDKWLRPNAVIDIIQK